MENLDYAIRLLVWELKHHEEQLEYTVDLDTVLIPQINSIKAAIEILEQHKTQNK